MRIEGLVSVIVPIYKVEAYLERCVDSIINQTYKNLEIILVDDGSPDRCGEICDNYATKDSRIVVIHKENGGLSDARNAGIEKAQGEYLSFVDSDDWIEPNMIEVLYKACVDNSVKIACVGMYIVDENDNKFIRACPRKREVVSMQNALSLMFSNEEISFSSCDKLYSFELFKSVRFPKGRIYEDLATVYKWFLLTDKIALCDIPMYNYFRRKNSITKSNFSDKKFEFAYVADEVFKDLQEKYSAIFNSLLKMKLYALGGVLSSFLLENKKTRNLHKNTYFCLLKDLKSTKKYWKKSGIDKKKIRSYRLMCIGLYGPLKRIQEVFKNEKD